MNHRETVGRAVDYENYSGWHANEGCRYDHCERIDPLALVPVFADTFLRLG